MNAPLFDRYVVSETRFSYKRHGRHGWGWLVIDRALQGSIAHSDTRERAQKYADEMNALERKEVGVLHRDGRLMDCLVCGRPLDIHEDGGHPAPVDD